jgi:glutamate decarboxylase
MAPPNYVGCLMPFQIDPEQLVQSLESTPYNQPRNQTHLGRSTLTPYSSKSAQAGRSRHGLPQDGAPAKVVAQMIRDELDLDGQPDLNLGSFVGTYMEDEVNAISEFRSC